MQSYVLLVEDGIFLFLTQIGELSGLCGSRRGWIPEGLQGGSSDRTLVKTWRTHTQLLASSLLSVAALVLSHFQLSACIIQQLRTPLN